MAALGGIGSISKMCPVSLRRISPLVHFCTIGRYVRNGATLVPQYGFHICSAKINQAVAPMFSVCA